MKKDNNGIGDNNVIWMKGMKDIVDKEALNPNSNNPTKRDSDREIKSYAININSGPSIILANNNSTPSSKAVEINYKKNSKDIKDYIETQKMLIELEKIQNDEVEEEICYDLEANYENYDILNEFKEMNDDIWEENNFDYVSQSKELNEKLEKYFSNQLSTEGDVLINNYSERGVEYNLRTELENELGKEPLNLVYKILSENVNSDILFFDIENLNKIVINECAAAKIEESSIDSCLIKMPDIYCLIIKDREIKVENN